MMKPTALSLLLLLGLTGQALAEGVPKAGHRDSRIRNAAYDPDQVFVIETNLRFATTIHFGRGERFEAALNLARLGQGPLVRGDAISWLPGALSGWTQTRDLRPLPQESFRAWWRERERAGAGGNGGEAGTPSGGEE